jgi:hypothetical protein
MSTEPNRGTGAGGKNTTINGKNLENKMSNKINLIKNDNFEEKKIEPQKEGKYNCYLEGEKNGNNVIFLEQDALKSYFRKFHDIEMCRNPDEAYFIKCPDNSYKLKILEIKNQNTGGSVEDKLLLGQYFKFVEYPQCIGEVLQIKVDYAFCLAPFLKNKYVSNSKKWEILKNNNEKNNISVFFEDDPEYFDKLDRWINL